MADIVLDHVSKRFPDGTKAVDDANLKIGDGEFVILVGPSGCGKSTCLNMIAGLEDISDGQLRIGGRVVNQLAPKDRDIAMVFQSYALYPHMSVADNVAYGLKIRRMDKAEIERRVNKVAEMLELGPLTSRCPTWTPSCGSRCARRSPRSSTTWTSPPSMSPTTRPRP